MGHEVFDRNPDPSGARRMTAQVWKDGAAKNGKPDANQ